jgi:indole-3-acetate monooxygenase
MLAALGRVAPVVRAEAERADREGHYPREVVDAMFEERLFRAWIPRSLGGDELDLPASLELFEEASRVDGSAGWLVTIGTGGALFAATMHPETAEEVYRPREALIAGSGTPSGHASAAPGGYRVTGRWRFASGAHHASWITANCTLDADGGTPTGDAPRVRAIAVPAERVQVLDTWQVLGLRATDSHDIALDGCFVDERHTFDVFDTPREPGPLYRFPFMGIASLSFGAVALGIARHGIEAFAASLTESRRAREDVRLRLGEAEATLGSARAYFFEQARRAWMCVERGDALDEREQAAVRLAASHAGAASVHALESLYLVAGMAPLFAASEFGRCWRDVHTVSQHSALSRENLSREAYGTGASGSPGA